MAARGQYRAVITVGRVKLVEAFENNKADYHTLLASKDGQQDSFFTLSNVTNVFFILFCYLLPILFMSWVFYKIQATLKRSAQHFQQQNVQGAALELLKARQNVISMLWIVMGTVIVLWTPLVFNMIICLPPSMEEWCYFSKSSATITFVLNLIFFMNPVINPIIYVFRYKKFRKGLRNMLCRCFGQPQRTNRTVVWIAMNKQNVYEP
ncbi:adenosine receptor A2b-like [Asterias rubens]|uniref:adenosine receptor A2b-like n=1 Tax=Asterias rubens TaxID=7604 RepID=UPI0014557433|nr:adenosine receptor A2b-like [Asterias rubens]